MSHPEPRRLPAAKSCYRLGDREGAYAVWSGAGAAAYPGRWNEAGQRVIYCAEHYSLAMLEKLAYASGEFPGPQYWIEAVIPKGSSYLRLDQDSLPGWREDPEVARAFGSRWYTQGKSLVLIVPSAIAPRESNVLVNTSHPDFETIEVSEETLVHWDQRLLS